MYVCMYICMYIGDELILVLISVSMQIPVVSKKMVFSGKTKITIIPLCTIVILRVVHGMLRYYIRRSVYWY